VHAANQLLFCFELGRGVRWSGADQGSARDVLAPNPGHGLRFPHESRGNVRALERGGQQELQRDVFLKMADQEEEHALSIEANGKRLTGGELPEHADMDVRGVETAPEWLTVDDISPEQALALA
jgi:hypothetical protein